MAGRGREEYKERGAGVRELRRSEIHSGASGRWQGGEKQGRRRRKEKELDMETEKAEIRVVKGERKLCTGKGSRGIEIQAARAQAEAGGPEVVFVGLGGEA